MGGLLRQVSMPVCQCHAFWFRGCFPPLSIISPALMPLLIPGKEVPETTAMPSAKIYVTRPLPEEALSLLRGCGEMGLWKRDEVIPRDVLLQEVREIEALLCMVTEQ